jgi:hypothetical protein
MDDAQLAFACNAQVQLSKNSEDVGAMFKLLIEFVAPLQSRYNLRIREDVIMMWGFGKYT